MVGPKVQDLTIRDFNGRSSLFDRNFDDMETRAVSIEFNRFRLNFQTTLELLSDIWELDPINDPVPIHSIVYREAFFTRLITCMEVYLTEVAKHVSKKKAIKDIRDQQCLTKYLRNYFLNEDVEERLNSVPTTQIFNILPERLFFQQKKKIKDFFKIFDISFPNDLKIENNCWAKIFGSEINSYISNRHLLVHNSGVITTIFEPMNNKYLINATHDIIHFVKAVEIHLTQIPLLNSFIGRNNKERIVYGSAYTTE